MHEVLVNGLGGLNLPRKSVVRLTDRPDMTSDVYCGCKTTTTIVVYRSALLIFRFIMVSIIEQTVSICYYPVYKYKPLIGNSSLEIE